MARFMRVKELIGESVPINEAQVRDAKPAFEQFVNVVPQVQEALAGALNTVRQVEAAAANATHDMTAAKQTASSIGVEQNAIIDNINATQQADPSQSIITLSDHRAGVQQAYNILSSMATALATAMGMCKQLNALAGRQFL